MIITNTKVRTPIGEGIVQGGFAVASQDAQGEGVVQAVLVRLPLNDVTRTQLSQSHCVTPHANHSALFVFALGELQ